jgi:hypothetical protein
MREGKVGEKDSPQTTSEEGSRAANDHEKKYHSNPMRFAKHRVELSGIRPDRGNCHDIGKRNN